MDSVLQHAVDDYIERINSILNHVNYDVEGSINNNVIIFSVTCNESEPDYYPTIELAFERYEDSRPESDGDIMWVAKPTISFPTLSYTFDDYPDSIEHYLREWSRIGRAITQLNNLEFDYTAFALEYGDEGVESSTEVTASSAAEVDENNPEEVARYIHVIIGDLDSSLNAAGIVHNITTTRDGFLSVELEDGSEVIVQDSDVSWNWQNLSEDVSGLVSMIQNTKVDACKDIKASEEDETSGWKKLMSKSVPDSDGFYTDYTLYESTSDSNSCSYICMFGDNEIYGPDEGYADWCGDSLEEAEEWFNSYRGFEDEEDEEIYSSKQNNRNKKPPKVAEDGMCFRVYVDGEVVGTFFDATSASMHAAKYFAQGYGLGSVTTEYEEY